MVQRTKAGETEFPVVDASGFDFGTAMIPKEKYTCPAFMEREWAALWTKVWLLACREDAIPEPGDYYVHDVGRESILVVRQQDDTVRAFYNVCQHRGNRVAPPGLGHTDDTLKCGYHHWEYDLSGRISRIPDIETFPQGAPCHGLVELACDSWGSFVWFTMNPEPEPLLEYLQPLPDQLDRYHFERMIMTRDWTVEWDCNWKTSVDAFNESYHVQGIHPQLLYYLDDYKVRIDCFGRHSRYIVPFATVSHRVGETTEIPPLIKLIMRDADMDPADFDGRVEDVRRAVQHWKREHGPEAGLDYSELEDDQLTDDYNYLIFPNVTLNTHADDLMLFRHRPHPTDPNRMYFDLQNFRLLKSDEEPPRRRPRHRHFKHGEKSLGLVLDQDAANLPRVQAGMHSTAFEGLWLGKQETRIRHFHKVIADYLERGARDGGREGP